MKKIFITLTATLFFIHGFSQGKTFEGTWLGLLDIGAKIRIVFHFNKDTSGKFTGTTDSPDQNVTGIVCSMVNVNGDSIYAEIKEMNAAFTGKRTSDTSISGMLAQGNAKLRLVLNKVDKIAALKRPQTPTPPFNYTSEDVEYNNAGGSIHFGGTFTFPKTAPPFPAIILITGSGQQDRDETIFEHKPFAVIADYLTKKGFAVLRTDDRGIGKTTGPVLTATTVDFADDAEAGIAYLISRKEVNKNKIGLYGHSEGGMIAPMVAARNKNVSFIILSGAAIVGGLEVNVEQNGYALQKAGIAEDAIDAFKGLHRLELKEFKASISKENFHTNLKAVYDKWKAVQQKKILDQLYAGDSSILGQNIYKMYDGLYINNWMRFFITHDFAGDLAKVHCPVLAINGEKDTQVDAKVNLPLIDSILKKNSSPSFKVVLLPGLNHLMQHAVTGDASEYGTIEETIAPAALNVIGKWLDENVKGK